MRLQVFLAYWFLANVAFLPGCKQSPKGASGGVTEDGRPIAPPDTATDAGARMARRIVKAATLNEAIAATREVLTRAGLTITDFNGATERPVGPASELIILPPEAVLLAHEARQHPTGGRLTLDDFASMLADLGWPFEGQGMPGEQLMAVMAEWVRLARLAPEEARNFVPLFLADMGRRQIPAVDLASDSTDPGEVRLGFLEMQLFAAALTSGAAEPVETGSVGGVPVIWASYGATVGRDACADIKKWFNSGLGGKAAGAGVKYQVSQELKAALVKSGLTEAAAKQVSQALSALKSAMKIVKVSELYGSATLTLDHASDLPAERPAPGGTVYTSVRAQAGLATDAQEEYKKSIKSAELVTGLRNCLDAAGLPTWSDAADVGAEVEKWRVHWHLQKGAPRHAWHVREKNDWFAYGQRSMLLKRKTASTGEAVYTFKLVPEAAPGHPGEDLKSQVTVEAELKTATPPGLGTVAGGAFGPLGLVKSLVDAGAGWFQEMVTFKSYITVPIVYHEPGISILIEDENQVVLTIGEPGKSIIGATGSERSRHVYAGSIRLGEDSLWHGQVLVTANGSYRTPDEKKALALAAKYANVDNMTLEQAMAALGENLAYLSNIPTCPGSYDGAQLFAVEGSFRTGAGGKEQVELAFIPAGPPEWYTSTSGCPWPANDIDGVKSLPVRLARGQETALVIDRPVKGQQRVYREVVNMGKIYGSTVTTVGADFTTGDQ